MDCTIDWTIYIYPCTTGCTTHLEIFTSRASWAVQQSVYPMAGGLYNSITAPWHMGCTICIYPMQHGLYNTSNNINLPCYMGCATVCLPHGRWIVQQYNCSMAHGLHNGSDSTCTPCTMGCTMHLNISTQAPSATFPHGSWAIQW